VALQYPLEFRFDNYTAVPFSHYLAKSFNHNLEIRFRNNDAVSRTIDSLYITFRNTQSTTDDDTLYLGSYSFPPQGNFFVSANNIDFHLPVDKQSIFNLKTKLVTNNTDPSDNNSAVSQIYLTNFYAFDDGTSEAGYGLAGDGTFEAMVATRFVTAKTDTLTAVSIYFNKTFDDAQPQYFYLMVWENDPQLGCPGELIYQQTGVEIDFNNRNNFQTFTLDSPVVVSDTFYIGWKKTDEQLMNVGLDLNNITDNYKFYNIYGNWQQSTIDGNLMIRPIFGSNNAAITSDITDFDLKIKIFPNPATSYTKITTQSRGTLQLYDLQGKLLLQKKVDDYTLLDLTDFSPGIYIIRFIAKNKTKAEKLIIR
jgi:hypothetical protein